MSKFEALAKLLKTAPEFLNKLKPKYTKADPSEFLNIVDKFRKESDLASANIHPYNLDDYKNMQVYLSPDKKSGYAIKNGNELVSVFSTEKGRGDDIVQDAIRAGAKKLDAYDINNKLPSLYNKFGFKETLRSPFNPDYADPSNKILNITKPDYVEMSIPDEVDLKTAEDVIGAFNTEERGLSTLRDPKAREQYLQALDEVYGPVKKREELTGHTVDVYHGTPEPFMGDSINLLKSGQNTGVNTANTFASTTSPRLAGEYADFGIESGNNIIPLKVNIKNMIERDAYGKSIPNSIRSKQVENAILQKKDGIVYKNLVDDPNEILQNPETVIFSGNPSNMRSKFAAFDPRFKNSSNLLAGGAALPMGAPEASPIPALKEVASTVANTYADLRDKAADYLADKINIYPESMRGSEPEQRTKELTSEALSLAADPINLLGGGLGIAAGVGQAAFEKPKMQRLEDKLRGK